MEAKFGIGDKIKVVNYGHRPSMGTFDMSASAVGKEGLVCEVTNTQGVWQYAVEGIPEKHAWYKEDQLEMINKNPNR